MSQEKTKGPFGLTPAEYQDLKVIGRMALAIFSAISITLIVVALASSLLS